MQRGRRNSAHSYFSRTTRTRRLTPLLGLLASKRLLSPYPEAFKRSGAIPKVSIRYAAMLKGDYAQAEKLFLEAIETSPSFYKFAYSNLQVLNRLKRAH